HRAAAAAARARGGSDPPAARLAGLGLDGADGGPGGRDRAKPAGRRGAQRGAGRRARARRPVSALHRFATPRSLALGLALLAIVRVLPSPGGDFICDDMRQIVENDQIRDLRNLPRFFAADVWAAAGIPYSSFYRPLMYTTFAFETALTGGEPQAWVFRVTNLLLHAGVCLTLFATMRRVGAPLSAAALA